MVQVRAANELLRQKKTERDAAHQRWSTADTVHREFKRAQAQAVEDHLMRGVTAADFVTTSARAEWLRMRAVDLHTQLEAAQVELSKAEAVAAAAQGQYRRELAKRDALNKLAAEEQRERTQKSWRTEEFETDDRVAYGHVMPR
jgi:hypothetical protein